MGLHNKNQLGCRECCCFARQPADPDKVAFIATGSNIHPHDDDLIWPYVGRAEDVFASLYDLNGLASFNEAAQRPGWFWGLTTNSAIGYGIVVLDPPIAAADFATFIPAYSPAVPDGATIIAHYGTPRGSIFFSPLIYEWAVDTRCNRYRLPNFGFGFDNPNLRLYRRVTRRPNAPDS